MIIGACTSDQLADDLAAMQLELTRDQIERIERPEDVCRPAFQAGPYSFRSSRPSSTAVDSSLSGIVGRSR